VRQVLETSGDHIVISTQVIEAGADVSARTLFTELAPWSSLVQRFGRCHRHGELGGGGADIRWLNLPEEESAPYRADELATAIQLLESLPEVSLAKLCRVPAPAITEPARHVIRPKDLRELFDTTPDIAGADLDVSRFIRDGDDTDCTVFWRTEDPDLISEGPSRDELCPVPVARLREFAEKHLKTKVWTWDALARKWVHPNHIMAGREYWFDGSLGGYDPAIGFDLKSKSPVVPIQGSNQRLEGHDDEFGTSMSIPETLEAHTSAMARHTERICLLLAVPKSLAEVIHQAAVWHDAGKAHFAFQEALKKANPALPTNTLWAKSGVKTRLDFGDRTRFRHELASALAFLASAAPSPNAALVAFLIAAHHGKVRLSLRSLPGEKGDKTNPDLLFARGVWDGDKLPPLVLAGENWPTTTLSLASMQMGLSQDETPSWMEACLGLRDLPEIGPFRLAYAETLLRAADQRASQESESKILQAS
jgi:CRISPR-associated endonuclease/helicase Cas3